MNAYPTNSTKAVRTLIEKYCRRDLPGIIADVISWGYLVVSESGDPDILPDPDDTLRIWYENGNGKVEKLTWFEEWVVLREFKREWGMD
jgi:hypothetical protein